MLMMSCGSFMACRKTSVLAYQTRLRHVLWSLCWPMP
jgi:hypothetical protein